MKQNKLKKTDDFMSLVQTVKQWFADEKLEVSDYVLGRMAVRLQEELSKQEQRIQEKYKGQTKREWYQRGYEDGFEAASKQKRIAQKMFLEAEQRIKRELREKLQSEATGAFDSEFGILIPLDKALSLLDTQEGCDCSGHKRIISPNDCVCSPDDAEDLRNCKQE